MEGEALTNEELAQVSSLAHKQLTLERRIEEAEDLLKMLKKELSKVAEDLLPAAMDELGISKISLSGIIGSIEVKDEWHASLAGAAKQAAINWLHDTGNDDIVSDTVSIDFGKGYATEATSLLAELHHKGLNAKLVVNVNTTQFKALCKELVESGTEVPLTEVGIFIQRKAVIK